MGMTSTTGLRRAALALTVLALLMAIGLLPSRRWVPSDVPGLRDPAVPSPFRWPPVEASRWGMFRSGEAAPVRAPVGTLASRYRLAGVFLMLSDTGRSGGEDRCAILDDLQSKEQILAAENEQFGSVRVVRVEPDRVILSAGGGQETIFLSAGTLAEPDAPRAATEPAQTILESNRFGNRVGEYRWEFSRDAVLEYYQEMMDNPERLAALFMAMGPDRDETGKVAGYRLDMDVGEREFYSQMGFQQGDIVRRVNSMRMTSQRRAEYFIGEFVQGRLGAVVIDIERDGQSKKLVYLVK